MMDITPEILTDEGTVGKVVGLPDSVVDSLRACEAFKITQNWGLFRKPGLLVREQSVAMSRLLTSCVEEGNIKKTATVVVHGERVTGKSLMLIHAMATAFVKGWIVLNIPEGKIFHLHLMKLANETTQLKNSPTPAPSIPLYLEHHQGYTPKTHTLRIGSGKLVNPTMRSSPNSK
jgi:hypothetical protein